MSPVYFTDRDLGKKFPEILRAAGITVERHADHFAPTTRDEEWLAKVGERGWVALTHDQQIRYKPNERAAVIENGVVLLVLVGHTTTIELADDFVRSRSLIERFVARSTAPYIAKLHRPSPAELRKNVLARGRIEHWYP